MSSQLIPSGVAENPADQAAADALYYRRILHELIDMGADLARLVHQQAISQAQATETGTDLPAPDFTVPFDRIARTIRRTVALARKLAEPIKAPSAAKPAAGGKTSPAGASSAWSRTPSRKRPAPEDIKTLCARAKATSPIATPPQAKNASTPGKNSPGP